MVFSILKMYFVDQLCFVFNLWTLEVIMKVKEPFNVQTYPTPATWHQACVPWRLSNPYYSKMNVSKPITIQSSPNVRGLICVIVCKYNVRKELIISYCIILCKKSTQIHTFGYSLKKSKRQVRITWEERIPNNVRYLEIRNWRRVATERVEWRQKLKRTRPDFGL